ncbi:MAG: trypsin-like serine protease [Spirochaetales bacterium]|nr:MAG: trypsin-like serine protease [Spirochaetales bacterium]
MCWRLSSTAGTAILIISGKALRKCRIKQLGTGPDLGYYICIGLEGNPVKQYTKGQVILIALASCILIVLLAIGFGIFKKKDTLPEKPLAAAAAPVEAPAFEEKKEAVQSSRITPVRSSDTYSADEMSNISVYEQFNSGVVNITTEIVAYNWFLEPVPQEGGSGSGSIIDKRGYVLTNKHVVENAYKVFINLADGNQFDGEVVGTDPENDLAIVKFNPGNENLVVIPFGSSSDLKVGQKVLAIGNPFGYERTLTTGIVSGLGRPVRTSNELVIKDMVQTDASINPGNSGGPLLDSQGKMIGINTMIYSPSGGSVGIGFAVSVDTAKRVVPELIQFGTVRRGWIDIIPVQLFPELVKYADLPVSKGLLVSQVSAKSSADAAGILGGTKPVRYGRSTIYIGGDIIVEVDGLAIESWADLYSSLEDNKPGEKVKVVVYRGQKKKDIIVTLSERPKNATFE